jgi:phosphoesterase RecJ-like protein
VKREISGEIKNLLSSAEQVLVVTHIGPDGDAIGSLTAVGVALRQLGKQATLACDDGVPSRFNFLPLTDYVQKGVNEKHQFDALIAVDCGDEMRMGQVFADQADPRPPLINIDHHITNTHFGAINLVEPQATSTAEILHRLFPQLGVQMTPDLATCLLTGIVTDTLGFRIVGVNPATLAAAGALMQAGADLSFIMQNALTVKPISTLQLYRTGLNNMKLEDDLLWTAISNREREAAGHLGAGSAGLVNMLADVDDVAIGMVLLEYNDGRVYVGFRCRPPFSVAELALNLGGGGHPLASGTTLKMPLAKAEALVVGMCKESIRTQQAMLPEDVVL